MAVVDMGPIKKHLQIVKTEDRYNWEMEKNVFRSNDLHAKPLKSVESVASHK